MKVKFKDFLFSLNLLYSRAATREHAMVGQNILWRVGQTFVWRRDEIVLIIVEITI